MDIEFRRATTPAQIARIANLAREIWYEYYVPLIGCEQVDYMVERFQSASAMTEQLQQGYRYFTVELVPAAETALPLGYFAVQAQFSAAKLFISKLYLHRTGRGQGLGSRTLAFIEQLARTQALDGLWLTVNKENPAVTTYQQWGFEIAAAMVVDIGGGFVMDDYRMEKPVAVVH